MSGTLTGPAYGGLVPGGLTGQQLSNITRRAVVPTLVSQIYQSHPLLSLLLMNAQRAKGGVSQITIPVQGASFTSFSWGSFAGDFPEPQDVAAINNAQFNLALGMVPIGFFGMEGVIQSSETIIPKLRAVTNDAAVVIKQALAQSIYANNYAQPQALNGLLQAYDDGTNAPSYGGLARAGNLWWQGQYYPNTASQMASRAGMASQIMRVQQGAGGESPDFGVMSIPDWTSLMTDFMNAENFQTTPRSKYGKDDPGNSGFRAIRVLDTPIFPDPFCPVGTCYLLNTRYLSAYISDALNFAFTGFESLIPVGQLASIGVLLTALNVVCSKPSSGARFTGLQSAAWPATNPQLPAVI